MANSVEIPVVGKAYSGSSSDVNPQTMVNMFFEPPISDGGRKALIGTPGLKEYAEYT